MYRLWLTGLQISTAVTAGGTQIIFVRYLKSRVLGFWLETRVTETNFC